MAPTRYTAFSDDALSDLEGSGLNTEEEADLAREIRARGGNPYPLGRFGRMAEEHWRKFLPELVAELEEQGELERALYSAQQKAKREMGDLMVEGYEWGMAWEIVAPKYILLDPARYEEQKPRRR